jgi:CIC family chloride channel protein
VTRPDDFLRAHVERARLRMSRERLRAMRHRWHRVLVLSGLTGLLVGLAVAAFEALVADVLLDSVAGLPDGALVIVPVGGLIATAVVLRVLGRRASPAIADDYLRAYHGRPRDGSLRGVCSRTLASVTTLGSGLALGFEGPAIFLGSSIGGALQRRFRRYFDDPDRHALLVAGAAAGVAAIFKAPATGAVFALEVPYRQDTASHAALPALVASGVSYLTFVVFFGTSRLFAVSGHPGFDVRDLLGALALGLACGVGARSFARMVKVAKSLWRRHRAASLVGGCVGVLLTGVVALLVFGEDLVLGPGYNAITWSLDPDRAIELVVLLFVLHALATTIAVAGGGAGGLFIPLFVQGWLLGRIAEGLAQTRTSLFPVVGAAAFLGGGYRAPIAAVVFVAESTGQPGFIVPALLATAVAQLVMGGQSITDEQLPRRIDALDRRLRQPVSVAMRPKGGGDGWPVTDATSPTIRLDAPLGEALELMRAADVDVLRVVDADRELVGTLRAHDVVERRDGEHG